MLTSECIALCIQNARPKYLQVLSIKANIHVDKDFDLAPLLTVNSKQNHRMQHNHTGQFSGQ